MPIAFSQIPANTLLPLFYAEVSAAPQPVAANLKLLLIGHMNKTYHEGTGVDGVVYLLTDDLALTLFGRGSQLHWMYQRARANAPFAEIWGIAIPDNPAPGVRAHGDIVVRNAPNRTRSGLMQFWVAGRPVQVMVNYDDTMHEVAVNIANTINARGLPVWATIPPAEPDPGSATVELVCKWEGLTGNVISVGSTGPAGRRSYYTAMATLARSVLTLPGALIDGAGEWETAGDVFAAIGDMPFDVFAFPFPDGGSMEACKNFMSNEAGRWSPSKQLYGHMVSARVAPYANQATWAETYNDPHMSVLAIQQTVVPPWEWAAALAAVMTVHWAAPPELSRPLQTLPLTGMYVGSEEAESYDRVERNHLLSLGLSTFGVDDDGGIRIDRVRTLRKTNLFGDPDAAWADAITMFQTQFFVRSMRAHIQSTFPRCALTDMPTGINGFASAQQITLAILHNYRMLQSAGLVENFAVFSQYLVVERDLFDRNRVNVLMRPDMVNQLRVVAALIETHLALDPGALEAVA